MLMNDKSHRVPALVLAAGFTTAVIISLSALAHSRLGTASPDTRLVFATTPFVSQTAVAESLIAPLRIEVVATRSQPGTAL
jgi:hypothetical protein